MTCDHSGYGARCSDCSPSMFTAAPRWQAFFEARRRWQAERTFQRWYRCRAPGCRGRALEDGLCWDHLERRVRRIISKQAV